MLKEFTVGASHTINLGNYESLRVEASVTVVIQEGEDYGTLRENAQKDLRTLLEQTYVAQRKKMAQQDRF